MEQRELRAQLESCEAELARAKAEVVRLELRALELREELNVQSLDSSDLTGDTGSEQLGQPAGEETEKEAQDTVEGEDHKELLEEEVEGSVAGRDRKLTKGERRKKVDRAGVRWRKGKVVKGGVQEAGYFEETLWDPRQIMPALGARPVGYISSCFPRRNGCPRQGSVVPSSRAKLDLMFGSNPHHSVVGLEDFSHVWLIFLFDGNGTNYCPRPRVYPPRLNGKTKGVFATRSPHRPLPIGLSLVKLDKVTGRTLHLSGVDLVDGTPILDVKPYIPCYDIPFANGEDGSEDLAMDMAEKLIADGKDLRYPSWCLPGAHTTIKVKFSEVAEKHFQDLQDEKKKLRIFPSYDELRKAIVQVLQADPRSVYRKESCVGEEYPFYVDSFDVRCVFASDSSEVEVRSLNFVDHDTQKTQRPGKPEAKIPAPEFSQLGTGLSYPEGLSSEQVEHLTGLGAVPTPVQVPGLTMRLVPAPAQLAPGTNPFTPVTAQSET